MKQGDRVKITGDNDINNFYTRPLSRYDLQGIVISVDDTLFQATIEFMYKFQLQTGTFRQEDLRVL